MYNVEFTNDWHEAEYSYSNWRSFDTSGLDSGERTIVAVTGKVLNSDPTAPAVVGMEGKDFQEQRGYILAKHPNKEGLYVAKGVTYSAKTLANFDRQRKKFHSYDPLEYLD